MKKIISVLMVIILIVSCKKNSSSTPEPVVDKPVIDIDGNSYDTVKIGSQFWIQENLNTSHYKNGDAIPKITDTKAWADTTIGAWCWYNNDSATYATTYGKLYNWYAVNDPRGIAPAGWHVPSYEEWNILSTGLGGDSIAGNKLKEAGNDHWATSIVSFPTNSTRFTALPAGIRVYNGAFGDIHQHTSFWTSTAGVAPPNAFFRQLRASDDLLINTESNKHFGYSIRCVKD